MFVDCSFSITLQRYYINYNLVTADNTIITAKTDDDYKYQTDGYEFRIQKMGKTGEEVDASAQTITYNGKTYVFDKTLSNGLKSKVTVKSELNYDTNYSSTNKVYSLLDKTEITTAYAYYKDESAVDKELGTVSATSIKVAEDGTVTWDAADNAVKYKVIKIGSNGKAYAGTETDKTTFKFAAVPTSDYEVQVVAFDQKDHSCRQGLLRQQVRRNFRYNGQRSNQGHDNSGTGIRCRGQFKPQRRCSS